MKIAIWPFWPLRFDRGIFVPDTLWMSFKMIFTPNYFSKQKLSTTVARGIFTFLITLSPALGFAEVHFEGYYKVTIAGVHTGYAIQRFDFDTGAKQFTSTYYVYVRTSPDGKKFTTESLVAKSNEKFEPISYQYTAILEGNPIQIDAKFNGLNMTAVMKRAGKPTTIKRDLPKGSFLSTMLLQLILQNGLKTGKGFSFNAVAEEDAEVRPGTARVVGEMKYKNRDAFRLEYEFKGINSVAYIDTAGQVLFSEAPAQSVSTELVSDPSQARLNFSFPEKTLKTLFGGLPTGQKNSLTGSEAQQPKSSPAPTSF
jgi:hypothetical protein